MWKSTSKLGCLRPVARSKIMPVPSYSGRDDILELTEDPDSIAAEVEESEDYRQDAHEILIRIENLFTSKVEKCVTSENIGSGSTQQIVHIPLENASRLPKLTLPHFSGDAADWINFWDCFSAAVDKKTSLSDAEKFTHLWSVLEGEAAAAILQA